MDTFVKYKKLYPYYFLISVLVNLSTKNDKIFHSRFCNSDRQPGCLVTYDGLINLLAMFFRLQFTNIFQNVAHQLRLIFSSTFNSRVPFLTLVGCEASSKFSLIGLKLGQTLTAFGFLSLHGLSHL